MANIFDAILAGKLSGGTGGNGGGGSAGAQSDWNANEGEPGHVLNRTHYEVNENHEATFEADENGFTSEQLEGFPVFSIGDTVEITVDGTKHTLVAYDDEIPIVGDSYMNLESGTGTYGWSVGVQDGMVFFASKSNHVVSWKSTYLRKLDKKYLPEALQIGEETYELTVTISAEDNSKLIVIENGVETILDYENAVFVDSYVKISDKIPTNEFEKSMVLNSGGEELGIEDYYDGFVEAGAVNDEYSFFEYFVVVRAAGANINESTFPETGLYLITSLLSDQPTTFTWIDSIKQLDPKFIPDSAKSGVGVFLVEVTDSLDDNSNVVYSGSATYAEIGAAIAAGKVVYCVYGRDAYPVSQIKGTGIFTGIQIRAVDPGFIVFGALNPGRNEYHYVICDEYENWNFYIHHFAE